MGKNHKHKKFLKSEKSKVKLKAKILPKGTNVTNTAFKVKKIVIREQLRDTSNSDVNVPLQAKQVLSRLNHHNHKALLDTLKDFKRLLENNFLYLYLHKLEDSLKGLAQLSLHEEKDVRRESFKVLYSLLIAIIEHKNNENDLKPFFETISSYLCCAMTHINPKVKEDSLLFLDVLLNSVPSLVVSNSNKIFNNFLDFISKLREGSKSRSLTLNLNSSLTSLKWRMKVFERLANMLRFIVANNINEKSVDDVINNQLSENNLRLHTRKPDYLGYSKISISKNKPDSLDNFKNYIEVIFPLLFDTWMEVKPYNGIGVQHNMRTNQIAENNEIMLTILDIMVLLWNYVKSTDSSLKNNDISNWFVRTFRKSFNEILLEQFPYTKSDNQLQEHNNRGKVSGDINYHIAYLGIVFNPEPKDSIICTKVVTYLLQLLSFVQAGRKLNEQDSLNIYILCKTILIGVSNKWNNYVSINGIIEIILHIVQQQDSTLGKYLQALLIEITDSPKVHHLNGYPSFDKWLSDLPNLLAEDISKQELHQLCSIANQKNKSFMASLKLTLPQIINKVTANLKTMEDAQCFARLLQEVNPVLSTEERNVILESISENCNKVISTNIFLIFLN